MWSLFSVKSISLKIVPTVATSWISAKRLVARSRVQIAKSVTSREETPATQRAVLIKDISFTFSFLGIVHLCGFSQAKILHFKNGLPFK